MSEERVLCHRCGYRSTLPGERHCPADGRALISEEAHRAATDDPWLGSHIGPARYPLLERVEGEALVTTYRALHPATERELTLVLLRPAPSVPLAEAEARFLKEARGVARLDHPAIVPLLDFGATGDGAFFCVREQQLGRPLAGADGTFQHGLSGMALAELFLDVLDALDYAYRKGVVHRDLRPRGIVLAPAGGQAGGPPCARLLDFGLARLLDPFLPGAAPAAGSPLPAALRYAAPEVLAGQAGDARSMVYSLAAILHEGLTGARSAPVPRQLLDLVLRGLARLPEDRWAGPRELSRALQGVLRLETPPSSTAPPGALTLPPPTPTTEAARPAGSLGLVFEFGADGSVSRLTGEELAAAAGGLRVPEATRPLPGTGALAEAKAGSNLAVELPPLDPGERDRMQVGRITDELARPIEIEPIRPLRPAGPAAAPPPAATPPAPALPASPDGARPLAAPLPPTARPPARREPSPPSGTPAPDAERALRPALPARPAGPASSASPAQAQPGSRRARPALWLGLTAGVCAAGLLFWVTQTDDRTVPATAGSGAAVAAPGPTPEASPEARQQATRLVDQASALLTRPDKRSEAEGLLSQALTLDPQQHRARFLLGKSWLAAGQAQPALDQLTQAWRAAPDELAYGLALAGAQEALGQVQPAIELLAGLQRTVDAAPARRAEVPGLPLALGGLLLRNGAADQAAPYLERTITAAQAAGGVSAELWQLAGETQLQLGEHARAAAHFRQAVRQQDGLVDAWYGLARALLLQQRPDRRGAERALNRTIELDREDRHPDARKFLGYLYRDEGRRTDALQLLRSYLERLAEDARDRVEVSREVKALEGKADTFYMIR